VDYQSDKNDMSDTPFAPEPEPMQAGLKNDERIMATLAHLAIIAVLPAVVVPLLIWLIEKDKPGRSEFVVFHAKQAMIYQVLVLGATMVLSATMLLVPLAIVLGMAAWVYGIVAAVFTWTGRGFKYVWIGEYVKG